MGPVVAWKGMLGSGGKGGLKREGLAGLGSGVRAPPLVNGVISSEAAPVIGSE